MSENPLEDLNEAVQALANAVAAFADEPAPLVTQAVVVWEQATSEDSGVKREIRYAVPTDNYSLSGAVGLLRVAEKQVLEDVT